MPDAAKPRAKRRFRIAALVAAILGVLAALDVVPAVLVDPLVQVAHEVEQAL